MAKYGWRERNGRTGRENVLRDGTNGEQAESVNCRKAAVEEGADNYPTSQAETAMVERRLEQREMGGWPLPTDC